MPQRRTIYTAQPDRRQRRLRMVRNWLVVAVILVLAVLILRNLRTAGSAREITATPLSCYSDQDVKPFGSNVLYYDGASIHCLAASGAVRWSFPVGEGAEYSVGPDHLVIWVGSQLFIVDSAGRPSYNENMGSTVQFARIGSAYCAVVIGEDTAPHLIVKNLEGSQVDEERDAFSGMMLMDVGFYGEEGQYMWTMAMDIYSTAINTVLNTFQVGKMNTGEVDLGEFLAYDVIFEDGKLRVFTTQQMYTYDYKATPDVNSTMLVYGWKVIGEDIPERGSASILLAPTAQTSSVNQITELRVLQGSIDRRYTLPSTCVGAAVSGRYLYAFSQDYLYRCELNSQRFYGYAMPMRGDPCEGFIGLTEDGYALVTSGDTVYAVSLPQ